MTPETFLATGTTLKWLLGLAWLMPLAGFCVEIFAGYWSNRRSKTAAWMAVGCIGAGFVLSFAAFLTWGSATKWGALAAPASHDDHGHGHTHDMAIVRGQQPEATTPHTHPHPHGDHNHTHGDAAAHAPYTYAFSGKFYNLATIGNLVIDIDYYIDSLTITMFMMVTLIATCIHVFATGYMSDELTENYEDHEVHLSGGRHFPVSYTHLTLPTIYSV